MNIKVDFDNIVVKEDRNDFNVKILMLKGEKGDQGDGEPNVIETIQVNGTALPVSNKTVNVSVPTVDNAISSSSTNPVQNSAIYNALNNKVDTSALNNYYEVSEVDNLLNDKANILIVDKKPYYFDNIASMKAYDLKEGDFVITKGYYSANDGGNGNYIIIDDETLADDGGAFHQLSNGLMAMLIFDKEINVKQFGAKGDYEQLNENNTDNLTIFNNITKIIPNGGKIIVEDGDYFLSNNWLIDKENITIEVKPNATIRTMGVTSTGGCIQFLGHYDDVSSQTDLIPQRNYCKIYGGGKVISEGNGDATNTIGCCRYKHFIVDNIIIPHSDKKGITAQYGVENIVIKNCKIEEALTRGITVENSCKNIQILNNYINSINGASIYSYNCSDIEIMNNIVDCGLNDIYISGSNNIIIYNNYINSGNRSMWFNACKNINVSNNKIKDITDSAIVGQNTTGLFKIEANIFNTSIASPIISELLYFQSCSYPIIVNNVNETSNHTNIINSVSMTSTRGRLENNRWSSGGISGGRPYTMKDLINGVEYIIERANRIVYDTSVPSSGSWSSGDIVYNTNRTNGNDIGWICRATGTPGYWLSLGKFTDIS